MNTNIKDWLPGGQKSAYTFAGAIILAFLIGWSINSNSGNPQVQKDPAPANTHAAEATIWTCSMHPQIQQPKPGKCPICGMDLIPLVPAKHSSGNTADIVLSETARRLAEVETAPVERKYVENPIRMVGKIEYDETRVDYITAWVPGRLDRLFVNYTGIPVQKGEHMAEVYSPELLSTQQELIESLKQYHNLSKQAQPEMTATLKRQVESVRERLRLWGLTPSQISRIENNGRTSEHVTLYSPVTGIVVEKNALEGSYVQTGTRIYTIADLSQVWVKMDAYESDLSWLHYGQTVEFSTEAYPDETFKGKIAFIDPVIDQQTRTVKIRVNLTNKDNLLKPGMFVRAVVHSRVSAKGKVMDPDLSGKWICPMHPEIVKSRPGSCDVCGMDLVRAETLGYAKLDPAREDAPLVIPASAPLITGKRAVVYVAVPGEDGKYEGREIELGPRAGNYYLVKSGLREGETVVTRGNFKIDSAVQIQAGPSMMSPTAVVLADSSANLQKAEETKGKTSKQVTVPESFKKQLDALYTAYFSVQYGLSHDDLSAAKKAAVQVNTLLPEMVTKNLTAETRSAWLTIRTSIRKAADQVKESDDIEVARKAFDLLSKESIDLAKTFSSREQPLYVYHCPMAFNNRGADWLQNKKGTENPYFGSAMFTCGDLTDDLTPPSAVQSQGGETNE